MIGRLTVRANKAAQVIGIDAQNIEKTGQSGAEVLGIIDLVAALQGAGVAGAGVLGADGGHSANDGDEDSAGEHVAG